MSLSHTSPKRKTSMSLLVLALVITMTAPVAINAPVGNSALGTSMVDNQKGLVGFASPDRPKPVPLPSDPNGAAAKTTNTALAHEAQRVAGA